MLEKITYYISAALASTLVVTIIGSGLHATNVVEILLPRSTNIQDIGDDKFTSLSSHHHTHTNRFNIDGVRQLSDQRALRKYIHFGEKHTATILD